MVAASSCTRASSASGRLRGLLGLGHGRQGIATRLQAATGQVELAGQAGRLVTQRGQMALRIGQVLEGNATGRQGGARWVALPASGGFRVELLQRPAIEQGLELLPLCQCLLAASQLVTACRTPCLERSNTSSAGSPTASMPAATSRVPEGPRAESRRASPATLAASAACRPASSARRASPRERVTPPRHVPRRRQDRRRPPGGGSSASARTTPRSESARAGARSPRPGGPQGGQASVPVRCAHSLSPRPPTFDRRNRRYRGICRQAASSGLGDGLRSFPLGVGKRLAIDSQPGRPPRRAVRRISRSDPPWKAARRRQIRRQADPQQDGRRDGRARGEQDGGGQQGRNRLR